MPAPGGPAGPLGPAGRASTPAATPAATRAAAPHPRVTAGVSVWLDGLSRQRLASGRLAALARQGRIAGVVSDPAFLARSLAGGSCYTGQLGDLAERGVPAERALKALAVHDIRWACDILRPVHEATAGVDGLVCVTLDPRLAHDAAAALAEARALWRAVDRRNAVLGIPATTAGLTALSACLAEGINASATLVLSAARHRQAWDAYTEGLERARAAGRHLASLASVASFPVSRIDTAADALLDREGTLEARAMRGAVAVAAARHVHEQYERMLGEPRWHALAARGARPQRLLWTATTVPEPGASGLLPTRYAAPLLTRGTVTAVTEGTLEELDGLNGPDGPDGPDGLGGLKARELPELPGVQEAAGEAPDGPGPGTYAAARRLLGHLQWFGIDHGELASRLETEALKELNDAWHQLLDRVTLALDQGPAAGGGTARGDSRGG
ncbi:transaldolase family protein [Streptomyces sp. VNUA116]|uniref:transaldolase family protein n=1 Tax=Streptomyces sp. VNUA116 TaxID=3062449 RepID=UPI002674A51B|nr:transaldolase family protein [Streptomyces sp. VNUA116]WKU47478.1 transaldolase family protein [Streptomyces sp. VNUA116]